MKDEIKEIMELIGNAYYYGNITDEQKEKYCNCITNLQERNEKAINEVIRVLQIILEQPSKDKLDDLWIINKLEGIQTLLQGDDED